MSLEKKLRTDLQTAMRDKDETRKRTLRLALAAIKNRQVEVGGELTDADVAAILQKEAKQRRETLQDLTRAERPAMAVEEQAELEILQEYLPKQFGQAEIAEHARQVIAEVGAQGPQQTGEVMRLLMARLKGQADGKLVNQVVRELLSH
jgi:hypothetical protein